MTKPKGFDDSEHRAPASNPKLEAERAFQVYAYGCSLADAWTIARLGRWHQLTKLALAVHDFRRRSQEPRCPTEEEVSPRALAMHLGLAEPKTDVDAKALPWAWWHWSSELMRERGLGHLVRSPRSIDDLVAGASVGEPHVVQRDFSK